MYSCKTKILPTSSCDATGKWNWSFTGYIFVDKRRLLNRHWTDAQLYLSQMSRRWRLQYQHYGRGKRERVHRCRSYSNTVLILNSAVQNLEGSRQGAHARISRVAWQEDWRKMVLQRGSNLSEHTSVLKQLSHSGNIRYFCGECGSHVSH